MMRVASRPTPPTVRDALNTSAPYRVEQTGGLNYLYHENNNSLQRTLGQFKEHHRVCAIRRRRAAVVEVQRETQRTEFLAKKYMETVRQEHSNTSLSIGLVTPGTHHPNPSSSSQLHHSTGSTPTTNPPMSLSSGCSIKSSPSIDEGKISPVIDMAHSTLTSPVSNQTSSKQFSCDHSKGIPDTHNVKIEQTSIRDPSCSQAPSNGTKLTAITRCNSAGKVRSRLRQSSKDIIQRSLSISHSTPISSDNDSENDLTFTADDAYRLGTPLKPLEEETTITNVPPRKITSPPSSSQNGTTRSNTSASSLNVATPTPINSLAANGPTHSADNNLLMELDAFTKVMNQVERNEKEKERTQRRRISCPNPTTPLLESPSHLLSPPPYSISGGVYQSSNHQHVKQQFSSGPQKCFDSRTVYPPTHLDSFGGNIHHDSQGPTGIHRNGSNVHPNNPVGGIHGNPAGIHGNQDARYLPSSKEPCQSPHLQLTHHSSPHGQIGALLQSPTCSQSPTYETLGHTYQHSPVLHSPYPLWDSQGIGNVGSFSPSVNPRPGQKRNSVSSVYAPQPKIGHNTVSHMPDTNQLTNEPLPAGFQPHLSGTFGPTHVNSYPNYSRMS